jgi:hypothetical protein
MDFIRSIADPCAYTKDHIDGTIYLSVHVDNMLLLCPNKRDRKSFELKMEEQFEITKKDDVSYLDHSEDTRRH